MQTPPERFETNARARMRASRSTTSCTECRRRKQKCNQGQPCSNCKRRTPEPVCEYGPRNKQNKEIAGLPKDLFPTFSLEIDDAGPEARSRKSGDGGSSVGNRSRARHFTTASSSEDEDDDRGIAWQAVLDFRGTSPMLTPRPRDKERSQNRSRSTSRGSREPPLTPQAAWFLSAPTEAVVDLSMDPSKENAFLSLEFTRLMHRFKGSWAPEGPNDPDNPFVNIFVPWALKSPLNCLTSRYVAARSLAENSLIDRNIALQLNGLAIRELNQKLANEKIPSLDTMAGVAQFIGIEYFYGEFSVLELHLRGLRQVVQLRGGFPQHGVGALISKGALVNDYIIAMAQDKRPVLLKGPNFEYEYYEPPTDHLPINLNTPFLDGPFRFVDSAEELALHPSTTLMLDDLRYLIGRVLSLDNTSADKVREVRALATRIHQGISELPLSLVESFPIDPNLLAGEDDEPLKPQNFIPDSLAYSYSPRSSASPDPWSSPPATGSSPSNTTIDSPGCMHAELASAPFMGRHELPHPELLYAVVRAAAPIYARAIAKRQPLSVACTESDAMAVLRASFSIPLAHWRGTAGVFVFAFGAILPFMMRSTDPALRPHVVFAKGVMVIGHMQLCVENWSKLTEAAHRTLALQEWLRSSPMGDDHEMPMAATMAGLGIQQDTSAMEYMMDTYSLREDWENDYGANRMEEPRTIGVYAPGRVHPG